MKKCFTGDRYGMQKLKSVLYPLLFISSLAAEDPSAAGWSEGFALPELKAIVKSVPEITHLPAKPSPLQKEPPEKIAPNFTAATYQDSGVVPPDAMGAIGKEQYVLAANGRIRSFNKNTGKPDNGINISTDEFFIPVADGSFTTDSRIRYDRFADRWYILILAPLYTPNRIVMAVSDSGVITQATKWSFYPLDARPGLSPDYPTLGIDVNALYIGMNIMNNGKYVTSDAIVIPKKSLLEGTLKAFAFRNLVLPANLEGPVSPQGVDNFDPDAKEGFILGIDGLNGRMNLRRIKDPGTFPQISGNILITVPNSDWPLNVPQKGSIATHKFFLQGFDKRLGSTHIRDKMLYTAHNIGVDNLGMPAAAVPTRDGCMWYQMDVKDPEHPVIVQNGVLYQPSKNNDTEQRYFWTPGIMTNGLHTVMIACSTSGNAIFADAAYAYRYANDPPGTMREPVIYTKSNQVYTVGFAPYEWLRYGEYSHASVDPTDDMTLWSNAEFALALSSWGLQVIKVPAAPPPKIVSVSPSALDKSASAIPLKIKGESVDGHAFFEPGDGFPKHLSVEIEGVHVDKVNKVAPDEIELLVSVINPKPNPKIKIINPDGQTVDAVGLLRIKM